jgi:hypothetical protein
MRYLECDPEIAGLPPTVDVPISVEPFRGRYRITENGSVIEEVVDARTILDFLHARLFPTHCGSGHVRALSTPRCCDGRARGS